MSRATIYDVSQYANVSIATVSRVLNDPDRVSEKTRKRVLQAIDELNFVPKFEAVTRARQAAGRIGILTPFSTSDSFLDRLRGIIDALAELPYEPVIYDANSDAQQGGYLANLPMTRQVDGLIAIDLAIDNTAAQRLVKHQLPTVQIVPSNQATANDKLTTIIHDDAKGGRIAAEHLLSRGHQRFGYIGDTALPTVSKMFRDQKLDSFRQALALNGIALPDDYVKRGPLDMESAAGMMAQLLDLPKPPTALFASSDTQAIGALRTLRERGLRVPEDIAVIGFDDIAVASFIGLTTIDQQLKKSGRLAVEMLIKQIQLKKLIPESIALPFTLMRRDTT